MAARKEEIAETLRQRILTGLHFGTLHPGDRVPSVRQLESELDADPRVILAAYRRLEGEGLVELRPRSGIYVAHTSFAAGEMMPATAEWTVSVLVEALARGIPAVEFPERVRKCLETVRLRTACVEASVDQISELCTELGRDYGLESDGVDVADLTDGHLPYEVRRADLLVTTAFHAAVVERVGERLGKPVIVVSLRGEYLAEVQRLLREGHVYFVVVDSRAAAALTQTFGSGPGAANLRLMVLGEADPREMPDAAPAYVTVAARAALGELGLPPSVVPAMRLFSADSARQLLNFVIRTNIAAMLAQEAQRGAAAPR